MREARDHFEAQAARDGLVEASGALRTIAVSLIKIANDIRWMGRARAPAWARFSFPTCSPARSIMPGKVNPVMPEAVTQVAAQVIGNDAAVAFGGASGAFELNVYMPMMARNLLESFTLLANVSRRQAKLARGCPLDGRAGGHSAEDELGFLEGRTALLEELLRVRLALKTDRLVEAQAPRIAREDPQAHVGEAFVKHADARGFPKRPTDSRRPSPRRDVQGPDLAPLGTSTFVAAPAKGDEAQRVAALPGDERSGGAGCEDRDPRLFAVGDGERSQVLGRKQ